MIAGIGIDIVEIRRFEALLGRHQKLGRIFGPRELAQLEHRGPESYAANFCAKEAFSKALGTGVRGFSLSDVEVLRDPLGKPFYRLSGHAVALAQGLVFHVSISHSQLYAVAIAVAETAPLSDA